MEPNLEQHRNLYTLAAYLFDYKAPARKFDMGQYCIHAEHRTIILPMDAAEVFNECKTIACAVGHGPMAGVPVPESLLLGYKKIMQWRGEKGFWCEYASRAFGVGNYDDPLAKRFFSAAWVNEDNSPKGAAQRILHFLEGKFSPSEDDCFRRNYEGIKLKPKEAYGL